MAHLNDVTCGAARVPFVTTSDRFGVREGWAIPGQTGKDAPLIKNRSEAVRLAVKINNIIEGGNSHAVIN